MIPCSFVSCLDIRFIIVFTLISVKSTRSQDQECEPIKDIVFLDSNILSQKDQVQQALHILNNLVTNFPERSENAIAVIGKEIEQNRLLSLPDDDEELDKITKSLYDAPKPLAKISSHAIDRTLTSYFTPNKFKSESEIVFLFVSSLSSLDKTPSSLRKKKTFVVVFGESVSQQWKNISSREDHLFIVSRTEELSNISKRVVNLTCSDSKLYCDTDQFSRKKGAMCKDCSGNACPEDPTEDLETCEFRCPYFRRSVPDVAVFTNDISESADRTVKVQDYKPLTTTLIIAVIVGVLTVPVFAVVIVVYKRQHQQQTSARSDTEMQRIDRNERDINGGSTEDVLQHAALINETVAQQETQAAGGGQSDCEIADEEMAASLLKNEAEKEMNVLATGQPPIFDVQQKKM